MNWKCDVYVYESVYGGWTTHVAGCRRARLIIPDVPWVNLPTFGAQWDFNARHCSYPSGWHRAAASVVLWLAGRWHRLHMWSVRLSPLRPIGLPHDGEEFSDPGPGACAERLLRLRSLGYVVPDYAINALQAEQQEIDA